MEETKSVQYLLETEIKENNKIKNDIKSLLSFIKNNIGPYNDKLLLEEVFHRLNEINDKYIKP